MSRMVESSGGRNEWVTGAPQPGPEGRGQSGRLIQFIAHGAKERREADSRRLMGQLYLYDGSSGDEETAGGQKRVDEK
jgi:hypothetical protein